MKMIWNPAFINEEPHIIKTHFVINIQFQEQRKLIQLNKKLKNLKQDLNMAQQNKLSNKVVLVVIISNQKLLNPTLKTLTLKKLTI